MDLERIRAEIQEELRRDLPDAPEDKELERLLAELAVLSPPHLDVIDLLTAASPPARLAPGWEERRAARIKRAAAIGFKGGRAERVRREIARLRASSGSLGELIEACRIESRMSLEEAALFLGRTPSELKNLVESRDPRVFMGYPGATVARLVDAIGCPRSEFAEFARRALAQTREVGMSAEAKGPRAKPAASRPAERQAELEGAKDVAAAERWLREFLAA